MVTFASNRLFVGLPASELKMLVALTESRAYSTGQVIFQEGDPGDGLYLMEAGTVVISCPVNEQERRVLAKVGAGDFFGEMAVLDGEPRSATAMAENAVTLRFLPRNALIPMLGRSPLFLFNLTCAYSQRMRQFNKRYLEEVIAAERLALVGQFARAIVHDFKNPLNVIGLVAEMASGENASSELRRTARHRILKQVDRMNQMVNELLEFTRAPQGPASLARTDYLRFVSEQVHEIRPDAHLRQVGLELTLPGTAWVGLDGRRFSHVFHNLINNAVEAMPDGGQVFIRVRVAGATVETEIEDTGPGIPADLVGCLFEPFATRGKARGTGLGLSVCKRIVEDHGGRIGARCEPGRGAIFEFTLPIVGATGGPAERTAEARTHPKGT